MSVVLTGFQLMQLLAVVDHKADAQVVIDQPNGFMASVTHARLLNDHEVKYVPRSGEEAAAIEQQKIERAAAARDAAACPYGVTIDSPQVSERCYPNNREPNFTSNARLTSDKA